MKPKTTQSPISSTQTNPALALLFSLSLISLSSLSLFLISLLFRLKSLPTIHPSLLLDFSLEPISKFPCFFTYPPAETSFNPLNLELFFGKLELCSFMIMDAGAPLSSAESASGARMDSRLSPLRTCGVTVIAIAHIVFARSQEFDGQIGSLMKHMAALTRPVSPLVSAVQYLWLAVLTLIDTYILGVEHLVEIVFPPAGRVFNKIDKLIQIVEGLPRKLDDTIKKLPIILHQTPLLDYVLVHIIVWLKAFLSLLTSESTREKEIRIDINYREHGIESALAEEVHPSAESPSYLKSENFNKYPPLSDADETDFRSGAIAEPDRHLSYKEVVEKGMQETARVEENDAPMGYESEIKEEASVEKATEGKEENTTNKNAEEEANITPEADFLDSFESIWHITPPKKR